MAQGQPTNTLIFFLWFDLVLVLSLSIKFAVKRRDNSLVLGCKSSMLYSNTTVIGACVWIKIQIDFADILTFLEPFGVHYFFFSEEEQQLSFSAIYSSTLLCWNGSMCVFCRTTTTTRTSRPAVDLPTRQLILNHGSFSQTAYPSCLIVYWLCFSYISTWRASNSLYEKTIQ